MRLPVSTVRLVEGRSDARDTTDLVNEIRDRFVNEQASYYTEVSTEDATPTVIWTDELPANSMSVVFAEVVAVTADGAEAAAYGRRAAFRRPGVSAAVQVGTTNSAFTAEVTAGWDVTFAVSATTGFISLSVTGAAATSIEWRARVTALVTPWR